MPALKVDVDEAKLREAFEDFSLTLDNQDVIEKFLELCTVYRLNAEDAVSEWMAFSMTNGDLPLNLEQVERLENDVLIKKGIQVKKPSSSSEGTPVLFESPNIGNDFDDEDQLFDAYTPGMKGTVKRTAVRTPDSSVKRVRSQATPTGSVSPLISTPSQKYSSRTNSNDVLISFGTNVKGTWKGSDPVNCEVLPFDPNTCLKSGYKYMFQKLSEKAHILNGMIEEMGLQLQEKHQIDAFSHVGLPQQESVNVIGRICCDSVGKLNSQSVLLEGSVDSSAGKRVAVKLTDVNEYSLFPGQVVAMNGINSTGNKLVVKKVYEGVNQSLPDDMDTSLSTHGALHVVMAAGPFTTSDSLNHEPLNDLIKQLQSSSPDACILIGPFVDANHEQISNGSLATTFSTLFQDLMRNILRSTESCGTQLIIVPSLRDIHHEYVYPQPPFVLDGIAKGKEATETSRLHMVSEPSTFFINGVVFGVTSTDVLLHLGKEEISGPASQGDRLGRLVKHIFTQQSYYPLCPPPEDVPIDYQQFEIHATLPVTPHVFISPSDMRYFIKDIESSVCINPGRLTKGQGGGTFAQLLIQPASGTADRNITKRTSAKIVRV